MAEAPDLTGIVTQRNIVVISIRFRAGEDLAALEIVDVSYCLPLVKECVGDFTPLNCFWIHNETVLDKMNGDGTECAADSFHVEDVLRNDLSGSGGKIVARFVF